MKRMLVLCLLLMLIPVLCMAGMTAAGRAYHSRPHLPPPGSGEAGVVADTGKMEMELCKIVERHFLRCKPYEYKERNSFALPITGEATPELIEELLEKVSELCTGKVLFELKQEGGEMISKEVKCKK